MIVTFTRKWSLAALCVLGTVSGVFAGAIPVPNGSFELQQTDFADPRIDAWQKAPQPAGFDTNVFGAWENLSGMFVNSPEGSPERVVNAEGNQLAYFFAYPQAGLQQDNNTIDWSGAQSHAFNATYSPGKTYRFSAGLTSSTRQPLTPGSTLVMSLYYRDANSNIVTVASNTVTYDTNVFNDLTRLVRFDVVAPGVQASDPWAGKNIGIMFQATVAPELIGGVWDLDNVHLTEEIAVPNFSFESPSTQFADPFIDFWQKNPEPPGFNTNIFGPWVTMSGVFANSPASDPERVQNAEGNQLAYVFGYPGTGFYQEGQTGTAFDATYEIGQAYTLTVGLTSSSRQPLTPGSTLLLSLYYRNPASNAVTVASSLIVYEPSTFTNLTQLLDFDIEVPTVQVTDPWAGKPIGIKLQATPDPEFIGGVWDVDKVRLVASGASAPVLSNPRFANARFSFNLRSTAGQKLEVLSSTNIVSPIAAWTSLGTITNLTGSTLFTDTNAPVPARFYIVRQLP